jgi:hypothetical protein
MDDFEPATTDDDSSAPCWRCGAEFSRSILECPYCRYVENPEASEKTKWWRGGLTGVVLVVLIVAAIGGGFWWKHKADEASRKAKEECRFIGNC